ncbi:hypothetical protein [Thiohalobacter sp.]|uniref:hypothetical protein n=1 Tax=Thiohalobacter sp. TaxID=2025948 RepID=UPI002609087E|nr:hypothetical protein [Thiohalobacter sp.]
MYNFKNLALSACVLGTASLPGQVAASVVLDPDNWGWTNVWPNDIATNPPLVTSRPLILIGYGGSGAVEVNSSPFYPNQYTRMWSDGQIQVGGSTTTYPDNNPGYLRIVGDGSWQSATAEAADSIAVGIGGDGVMELYDGGYATARDIQLGSTNYDADILVDGFNAYLEAAGGSLFFSGDGTGLSRSLTIRNGGIAAAWDNDYSDGYVGGDVRLEQGDTVTVTDGGQLRFDLQVYNRGSIDVSNGGLLIQDNPYPVSSPGTFDGLVIASADGAASLTVSGPGSQAFVAYNARIGGTESIVVQDPNGGSQFADVPAHGTLVVENDGELTVIGDLVVSQTGTSGTLTVRAGGVVQANSVIVQEGGILNGGDGIVNANVVLAGGTLAPGNSPGQMTVAGDLDLSSGILDLEVAGTANGEYDVLDVWGNVVFGQDSVINISFINGFAPQQYDGFSFINAASVSGLELATVNILGLEPGFAYQLGSNSSSFTVFALSDGVSTTSPVPLPPAVWLFGSGLIGILGVGRRRDERR